MTAAYDASVRECGQGPVRTAQASVVAQARNIMMNPFRNRKELVRSRSAICWEHAEFIRQLGKRRFGQKI